MKNKVFLVALGSVFLAACGQVQQQPVTPPENRGQNPIESNTGATPEMPTGDVTSGSVDASTSSILTGYVKSIAITDGKDTITVNKIDFLTGDAADAAFAKANPQSCEEMKKEDNTDKCYALDGYYIVTGDEEISYPIASDAKIYLVNQQAGEGEDITIPVAKTYTDFKALTDDMSKKEIHLPFYFEVKDNQIVEVREQFIP